MVFFKSAYAFKVYYNHQYHYDDDGQSRIV